MAWSRTVVGALVTAAALTACRTDADISAGHFRCDVEHPCPPDRVCVAGLCELPGATPDASLPDAAIAVDAPIADAVPAAVDATPLPSCGKAETLVDDFSDGVADPAWNLRVDGIVTVTEEAGHLAIALAEIDAWQAGGYISRSAYDLTDSHVYLEVPMMLNTDTHAGVYLRVLMSDDSEVVLFQYEGTLYAKTSWDAEGEEVSAFYSAATHRWWRISEAAGELLWQTSPNGTTWTTIRSAPSPALIDNVRVELEASTYASIGQMPGTVWFASFNGGVAVPCQD